MPEIGQQMGRVGDRLHSHARVWNAQIERRGDDVDANHAGNLKVIVIAWAAAAMSYTVTEATTLVGVVGFGTAAGAVYASMKASLDRATSVIPLGIGMGLAVACMIFIHHLWIAVPFLIFLGAIGGYLVVPMNALLQHRGHMLMGAGRSIAVQNFNEQAAILALGGFYTDRKSTRLNSSHG